MDKKPKYICLCGNDKDFDYIGRDGKKSIWICEKCKKKFIH